MHRIATKGAVQKTVHCTEYINLWNVKCVYFVFVVWKSTSSPVISGSVIDTCTGQQWENSEVRRQADLYKSNHQEEWCLRAVQVVLGWQLNPEKRKQKPACLWVSSTATCSWTRWSTRGSSWDPNNRTTCHPWVRGEGERRARPLRNRRLREASWATGGARATGRTLPSCLTSWSGGKRRSPAYQRARSRTRRGEVHILSEDVGQLCIWIGHLIGGENPQESLELEKNWGFSWPWYCPLPCHSADLSGLCFWFVEKENQWTANFIDWPTIFMLLIIVPPNNDNRPQ